MCQGFYLIHKLMRNIVKFYHGSKENSNVTLRELNQEYWNEFINKCKAGFFHSIERTLIVFTQEKFHISMNKYHFYCSLLCTTYRVMKQLKDNKRHRAPEN